MSSLHVLIIPSWYPAYPGDFGGSFFREQAHALAKSGCKVGVIYPQLRSLKDWRSALNGRFGVSFEEDEGVPTYRGHGMNWFPRMTKLSSFLWEIYGLWLYKCYEKKYGRPDIIHAHSIFYAGHLARKILSSYGVPYVITEHSSAYGRGLISNSQIRLAKLAAFQAQKRIAVSEEFCKLLDGFYDDPRSKWTYIPNMVNDVFLDFPTPSSKRDEDSFVFLSVATLVPIKGHERLLRAFAKVCIKNDKSILKIGGDGPCRSELERLAGDLGISDKVMFLGLLKREQVLEEMAKADSFVLSSKYETFGVVVVEALALGKPVVATRCGGAESIIRNRDGILVPPDSVDELAEAMLLLYHKIDEFDLNEIRASCKSRFGAQAIAGRLKSIYVSSINDC